MANKKEAWGREEGRTSVVLDYRATLKQDLKQREQRYQEMATCTVMLMRKDITCAGCRGAAPGQARGDGLVFSAPTRVRDVSKQRRADKIRLKLLSLVSRHADSHTHPRLTCFLFLSLFFSGMKLN